METVLRAVSVYVVLLIVFKIAGCRTLLQMTNFDLILILIISEATQQALLGNDFSVVGAALTIITLICSDIIFGLFKKYLPGVDNMIDGVPVVLVADGIPNPKKLKMTDISVDDVMVAARCNQGIIDIKDIRFAILEKNGQISIIPYQ